MEVGVCERKLIGRRREEKGDNEDDTAPAVARGAAHMSRAARAARRICIFLETGQVFEWVYRCISLLLVIKLLHSRREPTSFGYNEPQLKGNFRICRYCKAYVYARRADSSDLALVAFRYI